MYLALLNDRGLAARIRERFVGYSEAVVAVSLGLLLGFTLAWLRAATFMMERH